MGNGRTFAGGRALLFLLVASSLLGAPPLYGQSEEPERWLHEGVELRKRGDDQAALALFSRAVAATGWPRAYAQLGLAEQALGLWVEADEHLQIALAADQDPWIARNLPALLAAARYVAEHVGALEVTGTRDAALTINGRSVGTLPLAGPLRFTAGTVVIEARRSGYVTEIRAVTLAPGGLTHERFQLLPLPPPTPPPTPLAADHVPARRPIYGRWWLWTAVGAVGVAALTVGLAVGLSARGNGRTLPDFGPNAAALRY
jgi:hypothetical protein